VLAILLLLLSLLCMKLVLRLLNILSRVRQFEPSNKVRERLGVSNSLLLALRGSTSNSNIGKTLN
jgi:hypothetical protein